MTAQNSKAPSLSLQAACLRVMFDYDPDTGVLTWRERPTYHFRSVQDCRGWNTQFAGKVAGCINSKGYRKVTIEGKDHRVHRVIWAMQTGEWPADQVDHENQNRSDNRWINLREATNPINGKNQSLHRTNTSGHNGVCWHKAAGKWRARIKVDGKTKYLGLFTEIEDAVAARKEADIEYGFHRNHGAEKVT